MKQFYLQFEKFVRFIERISIAAASTGAIAMMLLITTDVFLRFFFSAPIKGSYEIAENILMISIVFLALSQAKHVSVTLITERLPKPMQHYIGQVVLFMVIILFFLMAWQSGFMFYVSWSQREIHDGILAFPLYPSRLIVFIGVFLFFLKLVMCFLKSFYIEKGKDLWT